MEPKTGSFEGVSWEELYPGSQIVEIKGLVKPEFCETLLKKFHASPNLQHKGIAGGYRSDKVSMDLFMTTQNDPQWKQLDEATFELIKMAIHVYAQLYPMINTVAFSDCGYQIQHYPQNEGKFDWHIDGGSPKDCHRLIALILYLNDVEEGGETQFANFPVSIKPEVGKIALFPTSWTHIHRGDVPKSGDKSIICTFFHLTPETASAT